MQTIFVRGMRLRLVFMVLVLLAFTCNVLAASSGKTIPFDEVNHRLETVLQELSRTAQVRPSALSQLAKDRGITLEGEDSITVVIEPVSGNASRIDRAAVRALGGTIEATSKSLMRVQVPINRLEAMADQVNGIAFIRLPYQPRPLAITSEGVALTGASDFHTAGYYGQGTKVAIIDLGFIGLTTAQAAGELDNIVYTHDYTGGGLETYTKHGTGVAEVVADMAPQASLYLLMIGDSVDLQNATDYCITNGIDIINHSVGWYNSNYYDGTGTVAGIANNARDNGILWVNAAGNEASDGHWQGTFVDADGDCYLDFGSGSDFVDGDAIDEGNRIYATVGDTIYVYMTWDDWTASNQDYDLYLYNSLGAIVASSANYQDGSQQPTEYLVYNVASSGNYEIVIKNFNASATPNIEFFAFTDSGANLSQQYHHPESTIITPANSAKVLTAGAIYRGNWTTGPQEYFSSQGPSNASKYAVSITKPDVMGPDGTSSYTYGTFYGTSAASPHVAGAAALLLSEDLTRTADQLQAKLEGDAIGMGSAGKDNLYGSGRLNLVPATAQDLVGYWCFNEGSGSTANDSSGLGNDGTIYGASWVSGSPDGSTALSFDGVNDCVEVPDDASLDITDAITIEAWVRLDSMTSGNPNIIAKDHAYFLGYASSTGRLRHGIHTGSWRVRVSSSATLEVGVWIHVAMIYDGVQMRFYKNGSLTDTFSVSGDINVDVSDLTIGAFEKVETQGKSQHFEGIIDELRIHGRVLDPSEFNLPPAGPTPPALVTDFNASDGGNSQSTLTWINPSDSDLAQVLVNRKTGSYPADHSDGTTIYDNTSPTPGAGINYTDTGLTNGTPYYYAVFSRDSDNNWNDTVQAGSNADTGAPSIAGVPVGHWQFNEGSGPTAGDSSGLGNDGDILGASWVSGSPDGSTALSFDGVNDCVEVPDDASLDITDAITIEAWVRLDSMTSGNPNIIAKDHAYFLGYESSTGRLRHGVHTGSWIVRGSSSATLEVGVWIHVAMIYDGVQMRFYKNGSLMDTFSVSGDINVDVSDLTIGAFEKVETQGKSQHFEGIIDELRIHGRVLDPSEFNLPPAGPTPPALVTDFNASDGEDSQSTLTWINPSDSDLAQVLVKRKTGSYPTDHTDGTTVYDNTSPTPGASITHTDTGLANGTTYYYAVFSRDTDNNWNDTVQEGSNADTGRPSAGGGPVGYWQFNEGSGPTAGDSSGLGNDGMILGASWVSGSPDGSTALSFDGVNDYVEVPDDASLDITDAITIEAWVKLDSMTSGNPNIIAKDHAYFLGYASSTGRLRHGIHTGSWRVRVSSSATLEVGVWIHVAMIYDGVQMRFYKNGSLTDTFSVSGNINVDVSDLTIGAFEKVETQGKSQHFEGIIDELRIHGRVLDPSEFNLLPADTPSALRSVELSLDSAFLRPNPVCSATVIFQAKGSGIAYIAVEVYDLSGKRVFNSNWQPGSIFEWNLKNNGRETMANGVYLYIVRARGFNDVEQASEVKKLAILR